ncbi:hypothetical protein VTK73DRAFT_6146 [Phialemonium thermophilum]|uniref:Clp1 N-terminal domain-containing protein n=1 Tax=Phialemonium thermophilum TaxID=223376 RepID=A0ABR3UZZ0_9PEZI
MEAFTDDPAQLPFAIRDVPRRYSASIREPLKRRGLAGTARAARGHGSVVVCYSLLVLSFRAKQIAPPAAGIRAQPAGEMSIPGLGQIPVEPAPSRTRTISLQPFWEWRFESPHPFSSSTLSSSTSNASAAGKLLTVRLVSGTAERDGTELALHVSYTIPGAKSKILTWTGCTLEVSAT